MKSKAYVINQKLPAAPAPTRATRIDDKPPMVCGLDLITNEQRKRAVKARHESANNAWTYEEFAKLKKLYKQGYTQSEIAEQFPGRTYSAICSKIRREEKRGQI